MSSTIDAGAPSGAARTALRRLFWRVHFWAGLVTAPLVLFAAGTGLLYVFTPQIEARLHAGLDRVPAARTTQSVATTVATTAAWPLEQQIASARAAQPGWQLRSIVPAHLPGETTQVLFSPPPAARAQHGGMAAAGEHEHGLPQGRIVYVNPSDAQVVGSLDEMARFKTWAKKLHSSALQGNAWRWPIELAASWMLLMFATGIAMWWRGGRLWPRWRQGRSTWRDLHTTVGVVMSGLLAVVLVTGLTWSRQAGDHFRTAQAALGQASPKPPKALQSGVTAGSAPLPAQAILDSARAALPQARLQLTPPGKPQGLWRVDTLAVANPAERMSLLLDAGTGDVLWRSGWDTLPVLAKATAIGIPFHRAEFGLWNQALLALAALSAIFSVVSGFAMAWQRRPARGIGAPAITRRQLNEVPRWLWLLSAVLAAALPVFGISVAVFVAVEIIFATRRHFHLSAAA